MGEYEFVFSKSLSVYHWYVKIPQCWYMEHGLQYIKCYDKTHIAPRTVSDNPHLVDTIR